MLQLCGLLAPSRVDAAQILNWEDLYRFSNWYQALDKLYRTIDVDRHKELLAGKSPGWISHGIDASLFNSANIQPSARSKYLESLNSELRGLTEIDEKFQRTPTPSQKNAVTTLYNIDRAFILPGKIVVLEELAKLRKLGTNLTNEAQRIYVFNHLRFLVTKQALEACKMSGPQQGPPDHSPKGLSYTVQFLCQAVLSTLMPRTLVMQASSVRISQRAYRRWPYAFLFILPYFDLLVNRTKATEMLNQETYSFAWYIAYSLIWSNGFWSKGDELVNIGRCIIKDFAPSDLGNFKAFEDSLRHLAPKPRVHSSVQVNDFGMQFLNHVLYGEYSWSDSNFRNPIKLVSGLHSPAGLNSFAMLRALRGDFIEVKGGKIISSETYLKETRNRHPFWLRGASDQFPGFPKPFHIIQFSKELYNGDCHGRKTSAPNCIKTLFPITKHAVEQIATYCSPSSQSPGNGNPIVVKLDNAGSGFPTTCYPDQRLYGDMTPWPY
jgi:hypothetical protein